MPSAVLKNHATPASRQRTIDDLLGPGGVRGSNLFAHDETLQALLQRDHSGLSERYDQQLNNFGSWVGSAVDSQAEYTHSHVPPRLDIYDRRGNIVNRVQHNPHYAQCQTELYKRGFVATDAGDSTTPSIISFSMGYLLGQVDLSLQLSGTLTAAVALVLQQYAPVDIRRTWLPRLLRRDGTALTASIWNAGHSCPTARKASGCSAHSNDSGAYLRGLEHDADAPDCDLALLCAYPASDADGSDGPGLYLVPRQLENHRLNRFLIRRLKAKPGTIGLANGEIELRDCAALILAAPPDGAAAMQAATAYSRLQAAFGAAACQRRCLLECVDFSASQHRKGRRLTRQAGIQDRLLSMRCEYEADMEMLFATANDFDRAMHAPQHSGWQRLLVCLAKYRASANAIAASSSSLTLLGSSGYDQASPVARLHHDALTLNCWGGSTDRLVTEAMTLLTPRFNIKERFGEHIRDLLDQAPMRVTRLSAGLRKGLVNYQEISRYLQQFPESSDRLGTPLLTLMSNLLAGSLLLRAAGADIQQGDARRTLLLHSYLQRHFPDTNRVLNISTSDYLFYFEPLITGSPIDAAGGWEKCFKNRL